MQAPACWPGLFDSIDMTETLFVILRSWMLVAGGRHTAELLLRARVCSAGPYAYRSVRAVQLMLPLLAAMVPMFAGSCAHSVSFTTEDHDAIWQHARPPAARGAGSEQRSRPPEGFR
jgi:hypothetical protein